MPVQPFFTLMRQIFDLIPYGARAICTVVILFVIFLALLDMIRK